MTDPSLPVPSALRNKPKVAIAATGRDDRASAAFDIGALRRIAYRGRAVITTDLLAQAYGTHAKNIQMNFANNESRFEEYVHFHRLDGDTLRAFKHSPNAIGVVDKRAPSLILWTARGAARHAKILDTDQAWEMFEKLEDAYFSPREIGEQQSAINPSILDVRLEPLEQALHHLEQMVKDIGSAADARLLRSLQQMFPATPKTPALPPPGYQRFSDFLSEKGIVCLTGGEKSGLSRRISRFCSTRGFKIEQGYGSAYRTGAAYPIYALDCWWRDAGGETMTLSLVRAHNARVSVRGAPLFPISGGKSA